MGIADDDEKETKTPKKIESAHLKEYTIIDCSLADNHALFLAKKVQAEPKEENVRVNDEPNMENVVAANVSSIPTILEDNEEVHEENGLADEVTPKASENLIESQEVMEH